MYSDEECMLDELSRSSSAVGSNTSPSATMSGVAPNSNSTHYVQCCTMRLSHPNDELGGMLLLMTPQVVVHEIDAYSPLMPPPMWLPNTPAAPSTAVSDDNRDDAVRWNPPAFDHALHPFHYSPAMDFMQHSGSPYGLDSSSFAHNDIIHEGIADVGQDCPDGKLRRTFSSASSGVSSSAPLPQPRGGNTRANPAQQYVELYHPSILSSMSFPHAAKRVSDECDPVTTRAPSALQGPFLPPGPSLRGVSAQELVTAASIDNGTRNKTFSANDFKRRHSMSPGTEVGRSSSPPITPAPPSVLLQSAPRSAVSLGGSASTVAAPGPFPSAGLYDFACAMNGLPALRHPPPIHASSRSSSHGKLFSSTKRRSEARRRAGLRWQDDEKVMVQRYMQDRQIEVIAIVEG